MHKRSALFPAQTYHRLFGQLGYAVAWKDDSFEIAGVDRALASVVTRIEIISREAGNGSGAWPGGGRGGSLEPFHCRGDLRQEPQTTAKLPVASTQKIRTKIHKQTPIPVDRLLPLASSFPEFRPAEL